MPVTSGLPPRSHGGTAGIDDCTRGLTADHAPLRCARRVPTRRLGDMMHLFGILAAGGVAVAILVAVPLLLAIPAVVAAWAGHRRDLRLAA